jgi:chorismate synthase
MFSIPGIKAIEFGDGFKVSSMRGSEYNDVILPDGNLATNHAGGVLGGLSNGNPIVFRVAVRPPASIGKAQQSIDLRSNQAVTIEIQGRHDTCFALRLPVVVEAMTAIVLADFWLISKTW